MSKWLNQDYLTRAYASRALSRPDVTVSRECQTSSLCPVIDYWLRSGHLRQWARHNSPPIILLHPHRSTPVKGEPILSNPREEIPKFPAQRFYLITITDPFDSRPYVRNVWLTFTLRIFVHRWFASPTRIKRNIPRVIGLSRAKINDGDAILAPLDY